MAFEDHVCILLSGAFDRPQKNKFKPQDDPEYYALVAAPPSAAADLQALMASINTNWASMGHPVKTNGSQVKPHVGIDPDWLVFRMQSQFVPEIRDSNGNELVPTAENAAYIRSQLYAGARVRVRGTVKEWEFSGKRGIKFYLGGVMAVGGGDRRATGSGSFDKYVPEGANQSSGFGSQPAPQEQAAPQQIGTNPFQQSNAGASTNPFG